MQGPTKVLIGAVGALVVAAAVYGWGVGLFYPCGPIDGVIGLSSCRVVARLERTEIEALLPLSLVSDCGAERPLYGATSEAPLIRPPQPHRRTATDGSGPATPFGARRTAHPPRPAAQGARSGRRSAPA